MRPGKQIHMLSANQRGVGLVEIMIGLTLGLLLMIALGYVFLASRQTTKTQDDLSRMQETGRLALDVMGESIRHASFSNNFEGGDAFTEAHPGVAWMAVSEGGGSGATATADGLTVRYDALVTGDSDCTGAAVAGGAKPANLVVATYSLNGTDLRCSNGTAAQPLFSTIENLQVEYGLDTTGDDSVDTYVTGSGVSNINLVRAIRVRLLVRSERDNISPVKQTYTFNGESATATDNRLRQEFVATYALRNRLP
jgi:type IV pilus assembly protein PilW